MTKTIGNKSKLKKTMETTLCTFWVMANDSRSTLPTAKQKEKRKKKQDPDKHPHLPLNKIITSQKKDKKENKS